MHLRHVQKCHLVLPRVEMETYHLESASLSLICIYFGQLRNRFPLPNELNSAAPEEKLADMLCSQP